MVFSVPCVTAFLFGYGNTWSSQCLLSGINTGINSLFNSKCLFCCCYINVLHYCIAGFVVEFMKHKDYLKKFFNSNLETVELFVIHITYWNVAILFRVKTCIVFWKSDFFSDDSLCKMSIISFWDHLFRQLAVTYGSYDFVFQEETESSCCGDCIIENTNDCSAGWI